MMMNEPAGKQVQDQGQPQGGGDPLAAMGKIQEAMQSIMQGIGDKAPPEAIKALSAAIDAYGQFLSIVTGNPRGGSQPAPGGAENAGGNPNAVPVQ